VLPSVFFSPPHSDMTHTSRHLVRDIASTATYGRASRLKTTTVDDEGGGLAYAVFSCAATALVVHFFGVQYNQLSNRGL